MELVEQQRLPQPRRAPSRGYAVAGERGQQLGVVQRALGAAVAALDRRLRRVGAAVQLEVELADDRPQVARRRPRGRRRTRPASGPWCAAGRGCRAARASRSSMSARRPAAAVAVAEDQQRVVRAAVVLVGRRLAAQLRDGRLGVVGVGGREVRQHLAAVEPLPGERVVLGLGEAVPGELLRQEAGDAGLAHQLRELRGVAERRPGSRTPCSGGRARARRTAGRRGTGARATRRYGRLQSGSIQVPPTGIQRPAATASLHPREQRRGAVAQPGVVLRLRVREDVLGIVVEQPQLRGRACGSACGRSPRAATATRCRGGRGRSPTCGGSRPSAARAAGRGARGRRRS